MEMAPREQLKMGLTGDSRTVFSSLIRRMIHFSSLHPPPTCQAQYCFICKINIYYSSFTMDPCDRLSEVLFYLHYLENNWTNNQVSLK